MHGETIKKCEWLPTVKDNEIWSLLKGIFDGQKEQRRAEQKGECQRKEGRGWGDFLGENSVSSISSSQLKKCTHIHMQQNVHTHTHTHMQQSATI